MLDWVENILAPYVVTAPVGVIPILFLESFKVHLMASVADVIQKLGVEIEYITPGCTGLVQPVDVVINKPFKAKMRTSYMEWLMDQDPDEAIMCIVDAVDKISEETVRNSWRKTGFSYFD
jgi:hypothetical protein